jgi:hypothetical protein
MRKTLTTLVTALAVSISGLAVAAPAQATQGDSRADVCTMREYRAIKNNMTLGQVQRILDGRGRETYRYDSPYWSDMDRVWGPRNYQSNAQECEVWFDRAGTTGTWRVYYKNYSGPSKSLSRYWG